jgi:hypothetical protein
MDHVSLFEKQGSFKNISVNIPGTSVSRRQNLLVQTQLSSEMSRETLKAGFYSGVDVNPVLGLLHRVDVGDVADVSEVLSASIFRVKDGGSMYLRNADNIPIFRLCNNPSTELTPIKRSFRKKNLFSRI